jgi:carbon monoxide dehydrogenase subunit G
MRLEHSFTVPVAIEDAWKVLLDIERVAPCMPGAALDSVDGDEFTGTVKVKLGPIGLTYKGKASFVEKDEAAHRVAINAQGRDARGNGTAAARVTATLSEGSGETKVDVLTDLDITGKPAQFGRGVMVDVGNKLIGQFADCLAGKLAGGDSAAEGESAESPAATAGGVAAAAESAAVVAADDGGKTSTAPAAKRAGAARTAAKAAPKAGPTAATTPDAAAATTADAAAETTTGAAAETTAGAAPAAPGAAAQPTAAETTQQARSTQPTPSTADEVEPINLLESAGPAVAKRLLPVLALVVLVLVVLRLRKR